MNANSITNPKLIFEPENVDQLLQGWLLHVHKGRDRHDLAARRCDRIRWWLGGSAAVLSAIVGTTIFAAVEKHLDNSSLTLKVLIISVGILAAILILLRVFYRAADLRPRHWRHAGAHRLAVEVHGTGAALRHAETVFRSCEAEVFAQDPEQRSGRIHVQIYAPLVYGEGDHQNTSVDEDRLRKEKILLQCALPARPSQWRTGRHLEPQRTQSHTE